MADEPALKALELRIPPLALCGLFALLILLLAALLPFANLAFPGHRWLSVLLQLAGVGVALAGVIEFRRARTTVNPLVPEQASSVVDSGIYRRTRNPMYLGMALVLLGLACWSVTLPGLLLVPIFVLYLTRFQILPEERALIGIFGAAYTAYMARVGRWF